MRIRGALQTSLLSAPPAQDVEPTGWLRVSVFVALFLVQISNAAYGVITKVALHGKGGVNPLVFSLLRDSLSFPLLEAIALMVDGALMPARGDVPRFIALGVFGMFGNQFCYILGLVYIDAGLASVINLLTPVCAWCFATVIGLDAYSPWQALGMLVAVAGAMVFVGVLELKQDAADGSGSSSSAAGHVGGSGVSAADKIKGSVAVFGSCVTMAIYYIIMKPMLKKYPPVSITAWSYFSGAVVMGAVSLVYVPWSTDWTHRPDPFKLGGATIGDAWIVTSKAWMAIGVAVVVNSVMKYGLTSFANKHTSVTVLAMFGTLVPVFTYLGEFLAGEALEWHKRYFGGVGILCG